VVRVPCSSCSLVVDWSKTPDDLSLLTWAES
jgi:hypothetical protein